MAIDFKIETKGISAAQNLLKRRLALIEKKRILALNQIGRRIENSVKERVPVKTGMLRDSIRYILEKDGVILGVPSSSRAAKYAAIVNEKHKSKKRYLESGVMTEYAQIEKLLQEVVK
jgi:hypothetical protein